MATHQPISIMASVCHGSLCFPTRWCTEGTETLEPPATKRSNNSFQFAHHMFHVLTVQRLRLRLDLRRQEMAHNYNDFV